MNKKQKSMKLLVPIIAVVIAIVISLVFVFNRKDTKEYDNRLEQAQKYVEEMDYKRAETAYLEAIKIDSKQPKAYLKLADVYVADEQADKAIKILNKGLKNVDKDNQKEIDSGVIIKADTVEELAKKLGIADPAVLVATVKRWNSDLREKGIDTEYGRTLTADPNMKAVFVGRDVKSWSAPIEEGPFYAVKLVPVTYHTMGGPKKSVKAEVLDPFGEPIPRLYVAGELGSTWGLTYQGACANADAMVFGRVAGKNAAALENWK